MLKPTYPDRVNLAHLPTALQELNRLSDYLGGPTLLIKRDDQTGLALGGNKTRKLEFLAADAMAMGCDYLITTGAAQSNHCRQTAAAAAALGLGCGLVLRGDPPPDRTGNLLLDTLVGADLFWSGEDLVDAVIQDTMTNVKSSGYSPYLIPLGGSNVLGAASYVLAMEELMGQLASWNADIDAIVVASSSGGTQAGLVLGADIYGFGGQILGISIDHTIQHLSHLVSSLAEATAVHLGLESKSYTSVVRVNDSYLGQGYGIMGKLERDAIQLLARYEGILLDPVYTARAMGGLLDLIRLGYFSADQRILFWHTGGAPALFAYGDELLLE